MLTTGLNETIDQLDMVNKVCWYGHVLKIEDGLVLRKTLWLKVKQRKGDKKNRSRLRKKA